MAVRMVKDRYELVRRLGSGGMGTVWLARDTMLGRPVALKQIALSGRGEAVEIQRQRALREARAAASVHHPVIVPVYDCFVEDDGAPWIVMAYVAGANLEERIEAGPLAEREVAALASRVLDGLMAAHRAGVLHRDVKPANIVVTHDGQVCLVDFGIARIAGEMGLTGTNVLLGTVEYMAPERIDGSDPDPAADLWSFGVTFFHALEGHSPFRRSSVPATFYAVLRDPLPPARHPGPLYDALAALLQKDPERRLDAAGLAARLNAILAPPIPTPPIPTPPVPTPPVPTPPIAAPPVSGPPVPAPPLHPPIRAIPRPVPRGPARDGETLVEAVWRRDRSGPRPDPSPRSASYARMEPRVAAQELDSLVTTRPAEAAATLAALPGQQTGRILEYMAVERAVAVLRTVPPGQGARLLAHTSERAAGTLIGALGVGSAAVRLVEAMTLARACGVLEHVPPDVTAGLLRASSDGRASRLLGGLSSATRAQIAQFD